VLTAGASSLAQEGASAAGADTPNALTRAAVQRGILQCASRVEQVTRFLGFGAQSGALLMAPVAPADQRVFSIQMELPAGASGNTLIDMSFAPGQANGCGATYQAISYWTQNCDAVAKNQFGAMKRLRPLQNEVAVLDGGQATKVFLMKAGENGCISIKKEVVL
jgi:hypothetical protein